MLNKTNLYEAHSQWATRPPDQRFPDLEALYNFTNTRRKASSEERLPVRELRVTVTEDDGLAINGSIPRSSLTHWSFGQLCSRTSSPAGYLRTLPTILAKECLQHSIQRVSGECKLLSEVMGSNGCRSLAAVTGPDYGRIWDADVVESLMCAVAGTGWHVPAGRPVFGSDYNGLYASDRDMFAFLVNDEKPIEVGNAKLGRGFFLWNSETGAATFGLTTFLYNYVCSNHIVWDAEEVEEMRIVHRKWAPERFGELALPMLNRFVESRGNTDRIVDTVAQAMKTRIGETLEEVQKWFKPRPFTQREVAQAWAVGNEEGENMTTLWGMLQGLTGSARKYAYANSRVDLEGRAGQLLKLAQN